MVMRGMGFPTGMVKDIYREILNTKGRFLGILAIVALGVAFFAGLGATGYDMKLTGDTYFDEQQLMDIRVISTFGLNNNDVKAISGINGVKTIHASYSMDAQTTRIGKTGNIKVHAYEADAEVNKPVLIYGELPQRSNECAVEEYLLWDMGFAIGDKLMLDSGKSSDIRNSLRNRTYTIVGVVESPQYISRERGTSSIGRGEVDYFMVIPQSNFLSDVYTEVFVRVEDAEALMCFTDEYEDLVKAVSDLIEEAGRFRVEERAREMTQRAYDRLREAETLLEQNRRETLLLLNEAQGQISESMGEIPSGYTGLTEALTEIIVQEREMEDSLALITSSLNTVRDAELALDIQEEKLRESYREVMAYESYLGAEFLERMRDVNDGLDAVAAARKALSDQKQALYVSFNDVSEGKRLLRETLNEVFDSGRSLVAGSYEISRQEIELETERVTLLAQLDDLRLQLEKTRTDLDDMDAPKWYVLDRNANPGYSSFSDDTNKIAAIGQVFPLIFFIVAALVCLTSMTRLVEDRRMEIGTLKALGYGNGAIVFKYLFYALSPTLIGGIIGGYAGMLLFPSIIITAYNMLYTTPDPLTPMNPVYWSIGLGMGLFSTGVATVYACIHELKEMPANLLRPKAPKAGKRILLERIGFLWRSLNFMQKVTVRNLLRFKKRLIMTVIGIGGCTALLLTAYGLRDSIADIIGKQFNDVNHYNMVVSFSDNAKEKDVTGANAVMTGNPIFRRSLMAREKSMDAVSVGGGNTYQASLVVPETVNGLNHFFTFRDRASHEIYTLNENGVIINEKLSRLLGVTPGEFIELRDGDEIIVRVPVIAVMETYFMHAVYMTPEMYKDLFGENPEYNTLYAIVDDTEEEAANELARILLDEKGVSGVFFVRSTIETFSEVINNLNFVVLVLILSAGALALVVLLNLTNINIIERYRELATIEVLGFFDREVSMYVYRENVLLTLIGAGFGLLLGHFLHLYVILTVETDIMMFGRDIRPLSYGYAVAMTFVFALIVNLLTANKLKKINMVEALKSVE